MSRLRRNIKGTELSETNNEKQTNWFNKQESNNKSEGNTKRVLKIFIILCVIYCTPPLFFALSKNVRDQVIFLNYLVNPFINYSNPDYYGISKTRNIYIKGKEGKLGTWVVLAEDSVSLNDGRPVVLYMHGNAYSRSKEHRVGLYKVLSSLRCHVVAFDYRGFGDSEGYPSEHGLIEDGLTMLKWIQSNTDQSAIYLWGHSLGSAVVSGVAPLLKDNEINGIILEGAFNNMQDGALYHPLSMPYQFIPVFVRFFDAINHMFKSDERIQNVSCSILFLHDHQDYIIGFDLGMKLYKAALKGKKESQIIKFQEFHGFGHNNIFESEELVQILSTFLSLKK